MPGNTQKQQGQEDACLRTRREQLGQRSGSGNTKEQFGQESLCLKTAWTEITVYEKSSKNPLRKSWDMSGMFDENTRLGTAGTGSSHSQPV